jgi:cytochrome b involved in lipid metabolism
MKKIVIISLIIFVLITLYVIIGGLVFSDPNPGVNPAQTLLNLNLAAQEGIATRINEKADVITLENSQDTPKKITVPTSNTTTPKNEPTTVAQNTTSALTPPAAAKCGSGGTCTSAQVTQHSSPSNCWVIYASKVYNISSYTGGSHPGGSSVFNSSSCGSDITSYLNGSASTAGQQHPHSSSAYADLSSFFIGNLSG